MKLKLFFSVMLTLLMLSVLGSDFIESNIIDPSYQDNKRIEVTYLAGTGFFVSCSGRSFLVDALFDINVSEGLPPRLHDHLPPDLLRELENAGKPFDNVTMVLVTHRHDDHFTANSTAKFLKNSPSSYLICPSDVGNELRQTGKLSDISFSRIKTVDPETGKSITLTQTGISVKVLGLDHSGRSTRKQRGENTAAPSLPAMPHQGYLVEIGGRKILHLGDSDAYTENFEPFKWLADENIDIAFIPYWFFQSREGKDILKKYINAEHLIVMHLNRGNIEELSKSINKMNDDLGDLTIFRKHLQKKSFSF